MTKLKKPKDYVIFVKLEEKLQLKQFKKLPSDEMKNRPRASAIETQVSQSAVSKISQPSFSAKPNIMIKLEKVFVSEDLYIYKQKHCFIDLSIYNTEIYPSPPLKITIVVEEGLKTK